MNVLGGLTSRLNAHHTRAANISVLTLLLDVGLGIAYGVTQGFGVYHGLYCAVGITTTVGCDVNPVNDTGRWLVLGMICSIPLAGAILGLFTTGLIADHVDKKHAQLQQQIEDTKPS